MQHNGLIPKNWNLGACQDGSAGEGATKRDVLSSVSRTDAKSAGRGGACCHPSAGEAETGRVLASLA